MAIVSMISCTKELDKEKGEQLLSKEYDLSVSSVTKDLDSVSADLDDDGIADIRLVASNNQHTITFQPAVVKLIQIERLHNKIAFAYTVQYNNSFNSRLYNFGSSSLFLFYAKSFSEGEYVDSLTSFSPARYYCTSNCVVNTVPGYVYNETVGDFANTTKYAAFKLDKTDGKHYGWLKISNANNAMNASLISSSFSKVPEEAVTVN